VNDMIPTQVLIGAVVAYLLQWLKGQRWFPFITEQGSKYAKVAISAVVAAASAFAIDFDWNGAAGTLLISGLTWSHIWGGLVAFGISFLSQHASYELLIHPNAALTLAVDAAVGDNTKILEALNKKPLNPIGGGK